jgi:SAM-dependent methyltransferase
MFAMTMVELVSICDEERNRESPVGVRMKLTVEPEAKRNASAHDRIAGDYDARHREIFNDIEQSRLRKALTQAAAGVATGASGRLRALDFGSGTGNVTRHLLELGFEVTATDVSLKSLELLAARYAHVGPLSTRYLSDAGLADEQPGQFDLVATYSVLHHVPDYLLCVRNLLRALRPGGILVIDHEVSPQYWDPPPALVELRSVTRASMNRERRMPDPRRVLNPHLWYHRFRKIMNPRYKPEGDIHVWPDDHIEWDRIADLLESTGVNVVHTEDYLVFRAQYDPATYSRYAPLCADMRLLIARTPTPLASQS